MTDYTFEQWMDGVRYGRPHAPAAPAPPAASAGHPLLPGQRALLAAMAAAGRPVTLSEVAGADPALAFRGLVWGSATRLEKLGLVRRAGKRRVKQNLLILWALTAAGRKAAGKAKAAG